IKLDECEIVGLEAGISDQASRFRPDHHLAHDSDDVHGSDQRKVLGSLRRFIDRNSKGHRGAVPRRQYVRRISQGVLFIDLRCNPAPCPRLKLIVGDFGGHISLSADLAQSVTQLESGPPTRGPGELAPAVSDRPRPVWQKAPPSHWFADMT